jgi:hypothetical protein
LGASTEHFSWVVFRVVERREAGLRKGIDAYIGRRLEKKGRGAKIRDL